MRHALIAQLVIVYSLASLAVGLPGRDASAQGRGGGRATYGQGDLQQTFSPLPGSRLVAPNPNVVGTTAPGRPGELSRPLGPQQSSVEARPMPPRALGAPGIGPAAAPAPAAGLPAPGAGPTRGPRDFLGSWYHGAWHGNNSPAWSSYPAAWAYAGNPGVGGGGISGAYGPTAGLLTATASPWAYGYWSYTNPYYSGGPSWGNYSYAQPLAMAVPSSAGAAIPATTTADTGDSATGFSISGSQAPALAGVDAARDAFKQSDYKTALDMLDKGIEAQPSDPVLHEFRALCEFALGNYRQAAAGIYNVLSAGPGWDWTTLVNLYPSVETYTSQLRALEEYVRLNPAAPDARFLLAYHYLVQGYDGAAGQQFREVMRLEPTNAVAAQLLQSMSNPSATLPPAPELEASGPNASAAQPAASQNSPQSAATRSAAQAALAETGVPAVATSAAIDPKLLVGHWSATGPAGSKFVLDLTPDHKFAWQFDRQGQSTAIRGTYKLVGDDLLALEGDNENNLVARIRFDAEHGMNFKLAGSGATDPGLTFVQ